MLVSLLSVAACGGSGDSASTTSTSTSEPAQEVAAESTTSTTSSTTTVQESGIEVGGDPSLWSLPDAADRRRLDQILKLVNYESRLDQEGGFTAFGSAFAVVSETGCRHLPADFDPEALLGEIEGFELAEPTFSASGSWASDLVICKVGNIWVSASNSAPTPVDEIEWDGYQSISLRGLVDPWDEEPVIAYGIETDADGIERIRKVAWATDGVSVDIWVEGMGNGFTSTVAARAAMSTAIRLMLDHRPDVLDPGEVEVPLQTPDIGPFLAPYREQARETGEDTLRIGGDCPVLDVPTALAFVPRLDPGADGFEIVGFEYSILGSVRCFLRVSSTSEAVIGMLVREVEFRDGTEMVEHYDRYVAPNVDVLTTGRPDFGVSAPGLPDAATYRATVQVSDDGSVIGDEVGVLSDGLQVSLVMVDASAESLPVDELLEALPVFYEAVIAQVTSG